MTRAQKSDPLAPFVAGLLAWIVPGAGHAYLGRKVRGLILCLTINALFWGGVAIGGVFTVEPIRERWWYAAQVCTGVSGLASWYRQDRQRRALLEECLRRIGRPGQQVVSYKDYLETLADKHMALTHPTDIVARAYTGIAGMLNLLCIFDAVMLGLMGRSGEPPPEPPRPSQEATP